MKYEKEFRLAHPETIGETDTAFDQSNYIDWLDNEHDKLLSDKHVNKPVNKGVFIANGTIGKPCSLCGGNAVAYVCKHHLDKLNRSYIPD